VWRIVGRCSLCRLVYSAVTVPHLFYSGVCLRLFCRRILVWAWCEASKAD